MCASAGSAKARDPSTTNSAPMMQMSRIVLWIVTVLAESTAQP